MVFGKEISRKMIELLKTEKQRRRAKQGIYHLASSKQLKWYCIYTKSRFETKLFQALLKSRFQVFLPMIKVKRVWSDRIKTLLVPLVSGYVFIKICSSQIYQLYSFPGFIRIVSFDGKPCVIPTKDIILLEQVEKYGLNSQITTICERGDWVRVIRGPLKGFEGRVENQKGNTRITFLLDSLYKSISVELGMADVEKCRP